MKLPNWKRFMLLTIFPETYSHCELIFFGWAVVNSFTFIFWVWVFPVIRCKLNILQRCAFDFLKDFLSFFPRHSFISDEVKEKKGSPKWLYIAPLKVGVCQIPNPEREFLMVKFKICLSDLLFFSLKTRSQEANPKTPKTYDSWH